MLVVSCQFFCWALSMIAPLSLPHPSRFHLLGTTPRWHLSSGDYFETREACLLWDRCIASLCYLESTSIDINMLSVVLQTGTDIRCVRSFISYFEANKACHSRHRCRFSPVLMLILCFQRNFYIYATLLYVKWLRGNRLYCKRRVLRRIQNVYKRGINAVHYQSSGFERQLYIPS